MEAELLKEMIDDREQCIAKIKRKSEEQLEKETRLKHELDEVQEKSTSQKIEYQTVKADLLHKRQQVTEKLEAVQRSLQEQGNSIKGYASVIQQEQVGDSSYVMRMQAQLCKAMHSMGIMDHQMELAKRHADTICKLQRDALSTMTEEKSQMELELMNSLMKADTERRDVETELKSKFDAIQKDIDAVVRQIEENKDSDEDESESESNNRDESEEEDPEEKEMKEELMQLLRDKKAEIERLEGEMEKQAETIEEMESDLDGGGGGGSSGGGSPERPKSKTTSEAPSSSSASDLLADVRRRLASSDDGDNEEEGDGSSSGDYDDDDEDDSGDGDGNGEDEETTEASEGGEGSANKDGGDGDDDDDDEPTGEDEDVSSSGNAATAADDGVDGGDDDGDRQQ